MSNTTNENKFVYGVLDKFELKNSATDVAVVGRVKGTLKRGDKIFITNYGDDDDELVVSSVVALEIEGKEAAEATDCFVAVRIRDGLSENIKPGSVIHSENASEEEIHIAYVTAIGDSYVGRRDLEIYETELSIMSITDCAESWRIFIKLHEKKEGVQASLICFPEQTNSKTIMFVHPLKFIYSPNLTRKWEKSIFLQICLRSERLKTARTVQA